MTTVDPVSSSTFEPFVPAAQTEELPEHLAVLEKKHHEDVNVRLMLVNLFGEVEEAKKNEIHIKNKELAKLKDKVETITSFLEHVSNQLINPRNKNVVLADKSQLVEKMKEIFDHEYLSRSTWTRDEAENLCKVFTRQSDRIQNDINVLGVEINRKFEDWHELVPIFKEILKQLSEQIDRINQRMSRT